MYQGKEHAARAALMIRAGQAPEGSALIIWLLSRLDEVEFTGDFAQEELGDLLLSEGPVTMETFEDATDREGRALEPLPGPVAKERA